MILYRIKKRVFWANFTENLLGRKTFRPKNFVRKPSAGNQPWPKYFADNHFRRKTFLTKLYTVVKTDPIKLTEHDENLLAQSWICYWLKQK